MATAVNEAKQDLATRAKLAHAKAQLEEERAEKDRRSKWRIESHKEIVRWLAQYFGTTAQEITILDADRDDEEAGSAIGVVDGLTFQVRESYDRMTLFVRRLCPSEHEVLVPLGTFQSSDPLGALARALRGDGTQHCRTCFVEKQLTAKDEIVDPVLAEIALVSDAGENLARAMDLELELQALRGIRKDEAVRRVVQAKGIAATPAEKIVEEDAEYFAFLKECRSSVADRIRAEAQLSVAKLRAQLMVRRSGSPE
jgi:hypothetical protein